MLKDFANMHAQNLSHDQQLCSEIMSLSGEIHRQVKSRITMRVEMQNGYFFIKKYYPLSLKEIIKNLASLKWPFADAINEYQSINAVKLLQIRTLDPVAYGCQKGIIQNKSFLITRAIEPNINLDSFAAKLISAKNYFKFKRSMIEYVAQCTRKLHLNGLNHRDYYLCHYLLNMSHEQVDDVINNFDQGDCAQINRTIIENLYLIDLHRMQIRNKVPNKFIIKDLSAMLFSVKSLKLTRTDYLRFLNAYMNFSSKESSKKFILKEKKFLGKIFARAKVTTEKG